MLETISTKMSHQQAPLFHDDEWLEAVAPGRWHRVSVEKKGRLVASLPYVEKVRQGISIVTTAPLTPYLGPWLAPTTARNAKRVGAEKNQILALVDQLPDRPIIRIPCNPLLRNVQPFYWRGYQLHVRYTYRLNDITNGDQLWQEMDNSLRGHIRKAEQQLTIRDDLGVEELYELAALTFKRQGLQVPYDLKMLKRLDEVMVGRNQRRILSAVDSVGRLHAANYLVWDDWMAYDLIRGADPSLRSSGAQSLLCWEAILFAGTVTKGYDFEGSMHENVERFFRSFGGSHVPYYFVEKLHPAFQLIQASKGLLKHFFTSAGRPHRTKDGR